jgi:hypothetical protein
VPLGEPERGTLEGFEVLRLPPPLDADALRGLAESATCLEKLEDASSSLERRHLTTACCSNEGDKGRI